MKKNLFSLILAIYFAFLCNINVYSQKTYNYITYPNDAFKVRIYTLENGLKVYLTVNKDVPRIQTAIAVKTGSKYDPSDNTGLSHYLEHMMFKGTDIFGTKDYLSEVKYLNKIDSLFEIYKAIKDSAERKFIYHKIDSISGIAAKYAIPNEYDKMLSVIGATETNAWTSEDETVYINNIPSNNIESWLLIESARFNKVVFRLFHTELETVYEEKNISLDSDEDRVWDSLSSGLFKYHTYGTQSVIGTIEHLKNPSIISMRNYFYSRYVPNNMAIVMSGDFDPDETIKLIDKYWCNFKKKELKEPIFNVEQPITKPFVKEVYGPDAESLDFAFRFNNTNIADLDKLKILDMILSNSVAGLIDINLNQSQKVLEASNYIYTLKDYSLHVFSGKPKENQTLEQLRDLILDQIELIKKGEFPDWLIPAIINELKLTEIKNSESNTARAFQLVESFTKDIDWKSKTEEIERLSKITKNDIIDFAKKYYNNNYVIIYKRNGIAKNIQKVAKPSITPITLNRTDESDFYRKIKDFKPNDIKPLFIDFDKDLSKVKLNDSIELLYRQNIDNQLFKLNYFFGLGLNNNKKLKYAFDYLQFLGTSKLSAAEIQQEFYKIGCSFDAKVSDDKINISLSGLDMNMEKGINMLESLFIDIQPDSIALDNLIQNIIKEREDEKLSKEAILWEAMFNYGIYGSNNPYKNILNNEELKKLTANELVSIIKDLKSYKHEILYYGKRSQDEIKKILTYSHKTPLQLSSIPSEIKYIQQNNSENNIYIVDYDMKQVEILMISNSANFNKELIPYTRVFNEYFGNNLVFQELREARALAYSTFASYKVSDRLSKKNYFYSYIGTQTDKLPEAMKSMTDIINNMPESKEYFQNSKEAIINQIKTERIIKSDILFYYLNAKKVNLTYDIRKDIYNRIPTMQYSDLIKFQNEYIKNRFYNIMILGKKENINIKEIEKYGKINYLTLEEIFGY